MEKNSKKLVTILYTENYGGKGYCAWLFREHYDGVAVNGGVGHKVAYKEDFDRLSEIMQDYLKRGFKVEVSADEDITLKS